MPPFLGLMDESGNRITQEPLRDLSDYNFRISPSEADNRHLRIINAEPILWTVKAKISAAGLLLFREVDDPEPVLRTRFSSVQSPVARETIAIERGFLRFDMQLDTKLVRAK